METKYYLRTAQGKRAEITLDLDTFNLVVDLIDFDDETKEEVETNCAKTLMENFTDVYDTVKNFHNISEERFNEIVEIIKPFYEKAEIEYILARYKEKDKNWQYFFATMDYALSHSFPVIYNIGKGFTITAAWQFLAILENAGITKGVFATLPDGPNWAAGAAIASNRGIDIIKGFILPDQI